MGRRLRIRLTIALVVLGIPLVLGALVAFYAATGRIGSLLAVEYARVMPGHLRIGGMQFTAADQVHLTDVAIAEGFADPLFTAKSIEAKVDVFNGRLRSIVMHGGFMRLDEDSFDLLRRIVEAGEHMEPSDPPQQWELEADGEAVFASGLRLTELKCRGRITGSLFEIEGTGRIGGAEARPFKARVYARPFGAAVPGAAPGKRISVALDDVEGPVPEALDAVASIGLLPATPEALKRWLPRRIDASGSVVNRDLGARRFVVPAQVRWTDAQGRPGAAVADLEADADRVAVAVTRLEDPALGRAVGNLAVDLRKRTVVFDAPRFAPGPGLAIPAVVDVDALLRQVPRLRVTYGIADGSATVALSGSEQSRARLSLSSAPDTPLRIEAGELPLTIAQGFMPVGAALAGGQISSLAMTLDGGTLGEARVKDLRLQVDQARGTWRGWSVGPLSGALSVAPQPDGALRIDAQLPMGTVGMLGAGTAGTGRIRVQAVDALLARIHGPVSLPNVTGALEVDFAWSRKAEGRLVIDVPRALVDRADMSFDGRELLQGVRTSLKGAVEVVQAAPGAPADIAIKAGGQLAAGEFRLPGTWLDLAAHTPIFTIDARVRTGAEARFDLRELLVRAADAAGTPQPDSYSAQFGGILDGEGTGRISGLVDHADLGWVTRTLKLPRDAVDGEGAVTCEAVFEHARMERLAGHFLPLNAGVQLGRFHASGITGAVDFTLDRRVVEGDGKK